MLDQLLFGELAAGGLVYTARVFWTGLDWYLSIVGIISNLPGSLAESSHQSIVAILICLAAQRQYGHACRCNSACRPLKDLLPPGMGSQALHSKAEVQHLQ